MDNIKEWEVFLKAAREMESDYSREIEKCKKLSAELETLKAEHALLLNKHKAENQKAQELEKRLKNMMENQPQESRVKGVKLAKQFNLLLKGLKEETERLKRTYPIFDLLAAKQAEVERMKQALKKVPKDHADRKAIESMVKSHIVERDELRGIAQDAENRFKTQLEMIKSAYLTSMEETASSSPDASASKSSGKTEKSPDWVRVPEH